MGASSSIEFISNTIWSNGNLTVGKSEIVEGESRVKTTHLSGALTVGKNEENFKATTTLNGKLTVTTDGAAITGNA